MLTPEEVRDRLNLGKTQYYETLKACGIKGEKTSEGVRISPEQFQQLQAYRAKQTGQTPPRIPEDSGSGSGEKSGGEIVTVPENSEAISGDDGPEIPQVDLGNSNSVAEFLRQVKEMKTREMTQPFDVTNELLRQMTLEDLDEDQQARVKAAEEAAKSPLASPAAIASQLLTQDRSGKNG